MPGLEFGAWPEFWNPRGLGAIDSCASLLFFPSFRLVTFPLGYVPSVGQVRMRRCVYARAKRLFFLVLCRQPSRLCAVM